MSRPTLIFWSGLTGKTGFEAVKAARSMSDAKIVMGASRRDMSDVISINGERFEGVKWWQYGQSCCDRASYYVVCSSVDVVVDFSSPEVFDEILDLAVHTGKPLISGTSDLSNRQMASLYDATNRIPVFRGGNFRFKVKKFIDEAVEFAKNNDDLVLTEQHWLGQPLPSEAAKRLVRAVREVTGKQVDIAYGVPYESDSLINEWLLDGDKDVAFSCKTAGFGELAHDVLEIAKVMAKKPVKKGEFYDLDELWDELPKDAL